MCKLVDVFDLTKDVLYGTGDSIHRAIYEIYKHHAVVPVPPDYDHVPSGERFAAGAAFAHANYKLNVINLYNSAFSNDMFIKAGQNFTFSSGAHQFQQIFTTEFDRWNTGGMQTASVREMINLTNIPKLADVASQMTRQEYEQRMADYNDLLELSRYSVTTNFTGSAAAIRQKVLKNQHTSEMEKFMNRYAAIDALRAILDNPDTTTQALFDTSNYGWISAMLPNSADTVGLYQRIRDLVSRQPLQPMFLTSASEAIDALALKLDIMTDGKIISTNTLMWEGIRKACKFGVDHFTGAGIIHYLIDGIDLNFVLDKTRVSGKMPICSSELRHIFKNWNQLEGKVLFYIDGKQCPAPWSEQMQRWDIKTKYKRWRGTMAPLTIMPSSDTNPLALTVASNPLGTVATGPQVSMSTVDALQILNLGPVVLSTNIIKKQFRDLSKIFHPDKISNPTALDTQFYQDILEAYHLLTDPKEDNSKEDEDTPTLAIEN